MFYNRFGFIRVSNNRNINNKNHSQTFLIMQVVMTGVATWLVDRSGRRVLLIVSIKTNLFIINFYQNYLNLKNSIIINHFS